MNDFGILSGWAALAAVAAAALAGRLLQRRKGRPRRYVLGIHAALAAGLLVLTVAHLSTSASAMGSADPTGIWLATGALAAILTQIVLGLTLLGAKPVSRVSFLAHRVTFGLIATLALFHVVLDKR